jgi:chromosome segregation ATPase
MYEEGKTYREITKEVHMSPGDISSIIKRHTGEPEKGEQQQQEVTIDTKVFKLFEEGKGPVQVAIDLNLPSMEVARLQSEYRKLMGLQELNQLQEEIGVDVFEFSRTYKFTKSHGYTPRQLIDAADHLDELPLLRSEKEQLVQESQYLETQKQNKTIKLEQVERSIATAQQNLDSVNASIRAKKEELELLNRRKQQIQMVIASMITGQGYQNMLLYAHVYHFFVLSF